MGAVSDRWTARDWRQMTALTLLALSAIPLTGVMAGALIEVHFNPRNTNAFWIGIAAAVLIFTNLIGLSAILGRRTFRIKVGENELNATGEDADRVLGAGDAA